MLWHALVVGAQQPGSLQICQSWALRVSPQVCLGGEGVY
jgi:hypothetical protein